MKNSNALEHRNTRRILPIACATALAVAFTVSLPQPAHAEHVTPPPVPANLEVPAGNTAFLVGHAIGTQNYVCLPSGAGFAYVLFTPEATLFDDHGKQIITHFFSPNPDPDPDGACTIRATWQDSDTSTVWAKATALRVPRRLTPTSSRRVPLPGSSLRWLEPRDGPRGGDTLSDTTFIQRLNTSGGLAPRRTVPR